MLAKMANWDANLKPLFVLSGGLGNQLFILAEALAYSSHTGREAFFSKVEIKKSDKLRGTSLSHLKFPMGYRLKYKGHVSTLLRLALSRFDNLVRDNLRFGSSSLGYDPELLLSNRAILLRGHFQTYKYLEFDSLKDFFRQIGPANPSSRYLALAEEFSGLPTLAIHIRLGDYKSLKDTFGLLSPEYYRTASRLAITKSPVPIQRICIFTDDQVGAQGYLSNDEFDSPVSFIGRHSGLSDSESLLLMSNAAALVMSNSTFS